MPEVCPICGAPYGKRRRCYYCTSKKRTGEMRTCPICGKDFYAAAWQLADVKRGQGTYCSNACKYQGQQRKIVPWAKPYEKTLSSNGYILIWAPDHPKANGGRVMEHVLIMEQKIGRSMIPDEEVHHIDGNKQNNDPANLLLVTASEHQKYHPPKRQRLVVVCQECGKAFEVKPSRVNTDDPTNRRKYCSLACRYKAWGRQMHVKRKEKLGY